MALNNPVANQIALGGGSVVVSSAGVITLTPATSQAVIINPVSGTPHLAFSLASIQKTLIGAAGSAGSGIAGSAVGDTIIISVASQRTLFSGDNGTTLHAAMSNAGAWSFNGTGTHTFSGPVKVSGASTIGNAFQAVITDALQTQILNAYRTADRRFALVSEANNDTTFYTVTGAGAGVGAEAIRLINANAYVQVATRLGIATLPSYPLHVIGDAYITSGGLGVGAIPSVSAARLIATATTAGYSAALFNQTVASATVPVVVVKLGATPGAGGDGIQLQNSASAVLARFTSAGAIQLANNVGFGAFNAAGTTAYSLVYISATDVATFGSVSLVTNLVGSNLGYTADALATVAGYVTARVNGTDRKLMIAA